MKDNIEKSIKRWLKRKVKITMATVVAFLVGSSLCMGETYDKVKKEDLKNIEIINDKKIEKIKESESETSIGIEIDKDKINVKNIGVIISKNIKGTAYGIQNMKDETKIKNKGSIKVEGNTATGIYNGGKVEIFENTGEIIVKGTKFSIGIRNINNKSNPSQINEIINLGLIEVVSEKEINAIENGNPSEGAIIDSIKNRGKLISKSLKERATGIYNNSGNIIKEIYNEGMFEIEGKADESGEFIDGVNNFFGEINKVENTGIISVKNTVDKPEKTMGISGSSSFINNGIIFAEKTTNEIEDGINNGLLIGDSSEFIKNKYPNNGVMFSWDKENSNYKIQGYKDTEENGVKIGNKTIVNATLIDEQNKNRDNWTATGSESIILEENKSDMIYNGITDTLKVSREKTLTNSIVNGYTSAIVFDKNGGSLTLYNSIINGGLNETSATIKGSNNTDNLALTNNTIINGNVDLGEGNDKLSIDNTVQLNGDLFGGNGNDTLIFNNVTTKSNDNNINIFGKINSFENINIETTVTFFEDAKITEAEKINIDENGNMLVRVGTEETNGKLNNHVLNDIGTIVSGKGTLTFNLNGNGVGSVIGMGEKNKTEISEELDIKSYSALHRIKKNSVGDLEVVKKEFEAPEKYKDLKGIYDSIFISKQDGEFTDTSEEKYGSFLNYLHDIYANNPYSFSSELSRKSVSMFSDVVMGRDLHPEVNKWAIYGGLTHIDGGTKDTYYGKGYYTYDVGSKDIDVDSKITGMYAQGEYGVNETLNLGVIFGGNQAESEINNNSKVEGDSFYLGVYAKKYLGNLRLLAGVGYQYGDYEADRVAVGYEGITTTRTFDSNYNDNSFNIYAQAKYSNKLANNLYLEPSVALDYTYINQDGVSENGILAIETEEKDFSYTTVKFGVDLRKDIPTTNATHLLLAGVYYNRMLDGYEEENITGRFKGGSDFDILVSPSNKHELGLRAKYEVTLDNGVTFDVKGSYTFERESYSGENKNTHNGEWTVGAGIGYKF